MASESGVHKREFLSFRLGGEYFAVAVSQVREVLDLVPVTKLPQLPEYVLGVINLRGRAVPVTDLRRRFGIPVGDGTRDTCVLVVEVAIAGEKVVVGLVADSVSEVLTLAGDQIEPPPRLGALLQAEFILGMGKKGEDFLILLDIDRVFADQVPVALPRAASPAA